MGSKLSRTVREHKAAASPRVATSADDQLDKDSNQAHEPMQTDNETTPVYDPVHEGPTSPTSIQDNDTMDTDPLPRPSTDSRAASILRELEQLPGGVAEEEPLPVPQATKQQQPTPSPSLQDCLICCTPCDGPGKNPAKEIHPCSRCSNAFCVPCVKAMFIDACKDLSRMPPRCCNQIPLHHVRAYLTQEEITLFKSKYEEWGTPNPFYCPVARCSTFIPNHMLPQARTKGKGRARVDSGIGTPTNPTVACPKCEVDICTNCRSVAHAGGICGRFDFGVDDATAELIQKWGYRKCPKCGNGVKRMFGCNHMECRCGAHFCWGCMQAMENCIGDCNDSEGDYDEDEPDEESDEETEDSEEEEEIPTGPAPSTSNLAHVFPHMSHAAEVAPSTTPQDEVTALEPGSTSARFRNLDGGSGYYWENQDVDFGDEPQEEYQDRSWDCSHQFNTAKIQFKDAFTDDAPANHMECMKCWATVHPEVEMPGSVRTDKSKITTAVASASRQIHGPHRRRTVHAPRGQQRTVSSLRGTRSMEDLEPASSAAPTSDTSLAYLSSSASQHSLRLAHQRQDDSTPQVVDLYGNTVAMARKAEDDDADEDMPDWEEEEEGNSRLSFTTSSTPFSFAYECYVCGLLVCHRCKDSLQSHGGSEEEGEDEIGDGGNGGSDSGHGEGGEAGAENEEAEQQRDDQKEEDHRDAQPEEEIAVDQERGEEIRLEGQNEGSDQGEEDVNEYATRDATTNRPEEDKDADYPAEKYTDEDFDYAQLFA